MSELINNKFRQEMALALSKNPEFVKASVEGCDGNHVGFCVAQQITLTLDVLNSLENKKQYTESNKLDKQ